MGHQEWVPCEKETIPEITVKEGLVDLSEHLKEEHNRLTFTPATLHYAIYHWGQLKVANESTCAVASKNATCERVEVAEEKGCPNKD